MSVFTHEQWAILDPLIAEVRPHGKTPQHALQRAVEAIVWRHQNGAKWRSILIE